MGESDAEEDGERRLTNVEADVLLVVILVATQGEVRESGS